ncbi:MAG: GNAT family N-acetyltransferase [Candidatus Thorarchaeota archaeon]
MIVRATHEHIEWIVRHRIEMFRSMGWTEEDLLNTEEVTRSFLENEWTDNPEILLDVEADEILGGVAINYSVRLPDNRNPTGKCAYVMNMYVEEEYRKKGIATKLMEEVLKICRGKSVGKVSLHATDMGERIYTKIGFKKSDNFYEVYLQ